MQASPELKKLNQRIQKKVQVTKLDNRMLTSNPPVIEMASVTLKNKQSDFSKGGKPRGIMTSQNAQARAINITQASGEE